MNTTLPYILGRNRSTQALGQVVSSKKTENGGDHSHPPIPVLSHEVEYVQLLSSRFLPFSRTGSTILPADFTFLLPLSSFHPGRALRPPEARQFCRFKVVEVIKLLKRSLGFASFLESPPFSSYPSPLLFHTPSSQPFFLHDYL